MKNIEIKTSFDPNMIRQTIDVNHGMYKNSQEQIINLSDDGVKQALSKLGYLNKEQALHLTNTVEQLQKDKDILLGEKNKLLGENKDLMQSKDLLKQTIRQLCKFIGENNNENIS